MNKEDIWIIGSDEEDQEIISSVWEELNLLNKLLFLKSEKEVFEHFASTSRSPFIIICEVNMPRISGFELRRHLLEQHERKFRSVPFIFWTTLASESQIVEAFNLSSHGFFIKEDTIEDMKVAFRTIVNYWSKSKMPSKKINVTE